MQFSDQTLKGTCLRLARCLQETRTDLDERRFNYRDSGERWTI
jgi:hypothetical protein